jgi:hypothetical protein
VALHQDKERRWEDSPVSTGTIVVIILVLVLAPEDLISGLILEERDSHDLFACIEALLAVIEVPIEVSGDWAIFIPLFGILADFLAAMI